MHVRACTLCMCETNTVFKLSHITHKGRERRAGTEGGGDEGKDGGEEGEGGGRGRRRGRGRSEGEEGELRGRSEGEGGGGGGGRGRT